MGPGYEVARALEEVIAAGHHPDVAWEYTPKQLQGWVELIFRRRAGEMAQSITATTFGSRADKKELDRQLKRLAEDSR